MTQRKVPPKLVAFDAARYLNDDEAITEYMTAVLEVNEPDLLLMAVSDVLRAKGMACYGIGPATDSEDGALGYGSHSDQERILEEALYQFMRFNWEAVKKIAAK